MRFNTANGLFGQIEQLARDIRDQKLHGCIRQKTVSVDISLMSSRLSRVRVSPRKTTYMSVLFVPEGSKNETRLSRESRSELSTFSLLPKFDVPLRVMEKKYGERKKISGAAYQVNMFLVEIRAGYHGIAMEAWEDEYCHE